MTMTAKEVGLFNSLLAKTQYFLEFGSGDSTSLAVSHIQIMRIDSVESDREFYESQLSHRPEIQNATQDGRLFFHFPDLGETREWGTPVNSDKKHLWSLYSSQVFENTIPYDLVLVDGRFRVACALQAIRFLGNSARVLIHDFTIRPQYRVLLRFFEIEDVADTLVLLKRKTDFNNKNFDNCLSTFASLPEDKTLWFKIFNRLPRILSEKLGISSKTD